MNKETKVLCTMYTQQFGSTDDFVVTENLTHKDL